MGYRNKQQLYIAIIFILALVIGVGYAFLNSTLNISGNAKIKENTWNVHFENFTPTIGSVEAAGAGIAVDTTTVNYTVTLQRPGDFYEFTVDAVNTGSIDAMINTFSNTGLTTTQAKYMSYSVAYADETEIAEKQLLVASTGREKLKVRVEYKKDISASDLPSENQQVTLTFLVQYVQADGSAVPVAHSVCKRAESLHSDGEHTFGRLGSGDELVAGDAFDCDVNKDGVFDSSTERFYYVAPLSTNNNYAVLIYSNNIDGASINNTVAIKYNSTSGSNYSGPIDAVKKMPTTSDWKNVNLSNVTRNITDETGTVKIDSFSYTGYAARLLTYQEVRLACNTNNPRNVGTLNGCSFLMENTIYSNSSYKNGYWLETVHSYSGSYAFSIDGSSYYRNVNSNTTNSGINGIRPAIEVAISRIQK